MEEFKRNDNNIIANRFSLIERLGNGSFGEVYAGKTIKQLYKINKKPLTFPIFNKKKSNW